MITAADVKFYKSIEHNFYDPAHNGGRIGTEEIHTGEINNVFDETTATQRENGALKRAKVFIKNTTSDRKMQSSFIAVSKDADAPDTVVLRVATRKPHFAFTLPSAVSAGTAAGTHVAYSDVDPQDADPSSFVGRKFDVGGQVLTVDGVDTSASELWFAEDVQSDIAAGTVANTEDDDDVFEADENFSQAKKYINAPIVVTLSTGDQYCYIPASDAAEVEAGDKLVIVDTYRRPMFRGEVASIEDGTDASSKKINFTTAYSGLTLTANTGFFATAIVTDIGPQEAYPVWMELHIGASNALNAEEVSGYQIEITFDDIAAG